MNDSRSDGAVGAWLMMLSICVEQLRALGVESAPAHETQTIVEQLRSLDSDDRKMITDEILRLLRQKRHEP